MAKADVKMPDEFLARISQIGAQTDSIVEKVLAGRRRGRFRKGSSNLKSVVGSGTKSQSRSTGELERSLGLSPLLSTKTEIMTSRWVSLNLVPMVQSNAKIANILEYGTSSQSAKPFLKPAKSAVKKVRGSHEIRI